MAGKHASQVGDGHGGDETVSGAHVRDGEVKHHLVCGGNLGNNITPQVNRQRVREFIGVCVSVTPPMPRYDGETMPSAGIRQKSQ